MTHKNIVFQCKHCKAQVEEQVMGVRNHCPKCLYSLHKDIFPMDNANPCHGLMEPVGVLYNENNEQLILHKCLTCGKTSRAKVALDDNYAKIIDILPQPASESLSQEEVLSQELEELENIDKEEDID